MPSTLLRITGILCWPKRVLYSTCLLLMTILPFSAKSISNNAISEECSGKVQNDDLRFQHLFPSWIKTIAVISPASPANSKQIDIGLHLLRNAGIRVKVMPHARERENSGYISLEAGKRVADLEQAWLDPEVDLILCTRGGVGSESLLEKINWEKLRKRDMPLIGFSNITALHGAMIAKNVGHPYSGPSLTSLLGCDQESLLRFRTTLEGKKLAPVKLQVLRPGKCSGIAIGGHLVMLAKLSRTEFSPDTTDKIIFIECPGQKTERVKAMLEKLRYAGFFRHCSGVVFGSFVRCGSPEVIAKLLLEFSHTVKCPVFAGYPYGHTSSNYLIDFKRSVAIDKNGIITP